MHKKRFFFIIIIGFLLFSLFLPGCGINLEYRLSKGDESKYKLQATTSSINKAADKSMSLKQKMEAEITQKVVSVDKNKNITMEVKYSNIKASAEQDGKPLPTPIAKDTSVEMKMTKKGKLLDFTGEDPLMEENMKKFSELKAIFPEKSVKVGESWENSDLMDIPFPPPTGVLIMKQTVNNKYTLEAIEKVENIKCAKIKITSTISQKLDKGKQTIQNTTIEYEGKGKIEGYFYFSITKGKVIKTTTEMSMNTTMTIKEGNKPPQKITSDVKSSMEMKIIS